MSGISPERGQPGKKKRSESHEPDKRRADSRSGNPAELGDCPPAPGW